MASSSPTIKRVWPASIAAHLAQHDGASQRQRRARHQNFGAGRALTAAIASSSVLSFRKQE